MHVNVPLQLTLVLVDVCLPSIFEADIDLPSSTTQWKHHADKWEVQFQTILFKDASLSKKRKN